MSRGRPAPRWRGGSRTAARLCALLNMPVGDAAPLGEEVVRALGARLERCGYAVPPIDAAMVERFERLRGDYAGRIEALVARLGAERARSAA